MASLWMVPAQPCLERGDGVSGAEKHTEATGHATLQTSSESMADRLAERRVGP